MHKGSRLRLIHAGLLCLIFGLVGSMALSASARRAKATNADISLTTFATTGMTLSDVLWTGDRFLYVPEDGWTIINGGSDGVGTDDFVSLPNNGEMRCVKGLASSGFSSQDIYCHTAHGVIFRVSPDGKSSSKLAVLPSTGKTAAASTVCPGRTPAPQITDGALTFDTGGHFGHALLAATGGSLSGPGAVYAIQANGQPHLIGSYPGPGGAENLAIAPPGFGTINGDVLITIDNCDGNGRLLAMDPHGSIQASKAFAIAPNPIVVLTAAKSAAPVGPDPGLYLTDWNNGYIYHASAAEFKKSYIGDVLIVGERPVVKNGNSQPDLHIIGWKKNALSDTPLSATMDIPDKRLNMEAATWIN